MYLAMGTLVSPERLPGVLPLHGASKKMTKKHWRELSVLMMR